MNGDQMNDQLILAWLVMFLVAVFVLMPAIFTVLTGEDNYWLCVKCGNAFAALVCLACLIVGVIIWAMAFLANYYA